MCAATTSGAGRKVVCMVCTHATSRKAVRMGVNVVGVHPSSGEAVVVRVVCTCSTSCKPVLVVVADTSSSTVNTVVVVLVIYASISVVRVSASSTGCRPALIQNKRVSIFNIKTTGSVCCCIRVCVISNRASHKIVCVVGTLPTSISAKCMGVVLIFTCSRTRVGVVVTEPARCSTTVVGVVDVNG